MFDQRAPAVMGSAGWPLVTKRPRFSMDRKPTFGGGPLWVKSRHCEPTPTNGGYLTLAAGKRPFRFRPIEAISQV